MQRSARTCCAVVIHSNKPLGHVQSPCYRTKCGHALASPPKDDIVPILQTELGDLASYDGEHHKAHTQLQDPANYARIESGLTFLGLAGLMDPPRPEVST
jgi:hypothetical protein